MPPPSRARLPQSIICLKGGECSLDAQKLTALQRWRLLRGIRIIKQLQISTTFLTPDPPIHRIHRRIMIQIIHGVLGGEIKSKASRGRVSLGCILEVKLREGGCGCLVDNSEMAYWTESVALVLGGFGLSIQNPFAEFGPEDG